MALILILDTQPPLASLLATRFGAPHAVKTATTAVEALRAVKRLASATVFVGLKKPGPEGWRFLRERRTRRIRVPFVVFSDDPAIAVWARRVAAPAFLYVGWASGGKQLTVNEAATRLGLTAEVIRRRIRQGTLRASVAPGSTVGYRIQKSDLSSIRPSSKVARPNQTKIQSTRSVISRAPLVGLWHARRERTFTQAELAARAGMDRT